MAGTALNTTNLKGSYNLLTTEDGETPSYCVNGVPIDTAEAEIVDSPTSPYAMTGAEDYILCTGTTTINAIAVDDADKVVNIGASGGTVTFVPNGSDTSQFTTIVDGDSVLLVPKTSTSEWRGA